MLFTEYGLDRILEVSGNIVKILTRKFSHHLQLTSLRERSATDNIAIESVLSVDTNQKFACWDIVDL